MAIQDLFEVFIGTNTGAFKRHVSFTNQTSELKDIKDLEKGNEILQLSWVDSDKKEILIGHQSGIIETYNLNTEKFEVHKKIKLEDAGIVGLGKVGKDIITAVKSGIITIWNGKNNVEINAGAPLDCMRLNGFSTNLLASGGKENQLKLWDIKTKSAIFTAKNIPNDMLQLRVPIWVSDIVFLNSNHIATASRFSNVCLYDVRAQRRPVTRLEGQDTTYSCLATTYKENTVAVGGGKGILHLIDLRKPGKILHKYKGFIGAVKNIQCAEGKPYMFSVSLDRRLRAHNIETTALLEETYLKSRLNCVLMRELEVKKEEEADSIENEPVLEAIDEETEDIVIETSQVYEDDPDDVDTIQTVTANKRKRKNRKKKNCNKKLKSN